MQTVKYTSVRMSASVAIPLDFSACTGGCGGGPSPTQRDTTGHPEASPSADPAHHLQTARSTTHHPKVLEQIGAHRAYALGLSGRGIRIGMEDSIVNYTQRAESGGRVRLLDPEPRR